MNESKHQPAPHIARDHRRQWRDCLYVYPVVSRRAKGLSVGINLNPDKACNFACRYCQINRNIRRGLHEVHLSILHDELHLALEEAASGRLWGEQPFVSTPPELRRVNDIAFSGDGEPTCMENFDRAVAEAAEVRREFRLPELKLVVITNATKLDSPQVQRALPKLDAANGEIWAKLDAGTEEYFRRVNRPRGNLRLKDIVRNIAAVARDREVVIQTLLMRIAGAGPTEAELLAYATRLREILSAGGKIRLVQLHTIARPPAEADVAPLTNTELDAAAVRIRLAVPNVKLETYYGANVRPQGL